ncbi:hypothetical protein DFH06DRAFT_1128761 [Mycena polygramma]|nr:hypothetical protein DFH06DRAFT_1128761 [Mycena polygramma]
MYEFEVDYLGVAPDPSMARDMTIEKYRAWKRELSASLYNDPSSAPGDMRNHGQYHQEDTQAPKWQYSTAMQGVEYAYNSAATSTTAQPLPTYVPTSMPARNYSHQNPQGHSQQYDTTMQGSGYASMSYAAPAIQPTAMPVNASMPPANGYGPQYPQHSNASPTNLRPRRERASSMVYVPSLPTYRAPVRAATKLYHQHQAVTERRGRTATNVFLRSNLSRRTIPAHNAPTFIGI